jgi:hypothetical protein
MLTTLMFSLLTSTPATVPATPLRAVGFGRPRVEVWTNRGDDPYHTGQRARVFFHADRDAYVTIFRVDTDGRVRVLFPREPWEDGFVSSDRDLEIQGRYDDGFDIDDYPGVGYVFAVAASDPFDYDPIMIGDHWDYRAIADGRVRGDPYVALTDLAERIVPSQSDDWDYDIVPYYVEQHYDYPRFLCYDCHSYASYRYWNPYSYSCVRFRIVVFDDPYYYPYRYYGGTRVVFTRPFRPEPRFIFKDRGGVGNDRFVTRERERPTNDNGRRGVRGIDLGGRGSIPVPGVRERGRRNDQPDQTRREGRLENGQRRDRPDQPDVRGGDDATRRQPGRSKDERRPSQRETDRRRTPAEPERPQVWRRPSDDQARPSERRPSDESSRPSERRPSDEPSRPSERRPSDERSRPSERRPPEERGQREAPQREARPERSGGDTRREEPRAEPRRGRDAAPPKPSGKPELRRRRP